MVNIAIGSSVGTEPQPGIQVEGQFPCLKHRAQPVSIVCLATEKLTGLAPSAFEGKLL